jgi:hypothetical protein
MVTGDGVAELTRHGLLPVAGWYKGWPLHDGRVLEAFTDTGATADATRAGQLHTADESAAYLRIRRSDLDHLIRAGLLAPADWGHGPFDRRDTFSVPLYRTGDLDDLPRWPTSTGRRYAPLRPGTDSRWPPCQPPRPRTRPNRPGAGRGPDDHAPLLEEEP